MNDTLLHLFRYKAWANDELLTALAKLDREAIVVKLAVKALSHTHVVDRIFAAHLFAFTDGAPGRMSREEMLMHVITHGVGHRGQVSAVMLLNELTPAKDGLTTYLHQAEAAQRRRIGA